MMSVNHTGRLLSKLAGGGKMLLVGGLEVYTGMCTCVTRPEDCLKYARIATRHLLDMPGGVVQED